MRNLKELLMQIGLTQNEVKCYLSLIEKGSLTIQDLSRKTNINRVNIYQTISGLEAKGCVVYDIKHKYRKKIIPNSPRQLLELVNKKQREFGKIETNLKNILPELLGKFKQKSTIPIVRFFEGIEGVKLALNDTLSAAEDLKGFSNTNILTEYIPKEWLDMYRRKKSESGFRGKFLLPDNVNAKEYLENAYLKFGYENYPEIKSISSDVFKITTEMDLYDNKVCIISLKKEEQIAIIMQSNVIAQTFKSIFETLWKIAA
ncbi:MAG: helix-turn-helix domain-containing protein [bacterium]